VAPTLRDTSDVIRPFTDDDLGDVLDVWYRASVEAHPFLTERFLDAERRQIAEKWLPAAETLVAELDARVVGFVSMLGDEVGGIFVEPAHQRLGVGSALMDAVTASRSHVVLDVFEANAIGRGFYTAYGFDEVGRSAEETTGLPLIRLRFDPRSL
jgi:putative acetyltransferase